MTFLAPTFSPAAATLTDEQATAVDLACTLAPGAGLRVRAGAGTGKTSTLRAMAAALAPLRGIYLAFNRTVAEAARATFAGAPCRPMTFHGLCLSAATPVMSGGPVRYDVRADIIDAGLLARHRRAIPSDWSEFGVALAAMRTFEAFTMSAAREIGANHARAAIVAATGDPDTLVAAGPRRRAARAIAVLSPMLVEIATAFWVARLADRRFSHDAYVKLVQLDPDLAARAFADADYAMVDEAQDMSPVQVAILRNAGIRVIAVGDSAQSIFGWRGAVDALDRFPGATATLSRSFRFGPDIAAMANRVLDATPEASHGVRLEGIGGAADADSFAILARSNLGLIDEAEALHARGVAFHLDRAEDLVGQIASARALRGGRRAAVTAPEIRPFRTWHDLAEQAEADGTLARIVQIVDEGRAESVASLARASRAPDAARVHLMTAHRAKGLEFGHVKLAEDWSDLGELRDRYEKVGGLSAGARIAAQQEFNTLYVAVTRAIHRVVGAETCLGGV